MLKGTPPFSPETSSTTGSAPQQQDPPRVALALTPRHCLCWDFSPGLASPRNPTSEAQPTHRGSETWSRTHTSTGIIAQQSRHSPAEQPGSPGVACRHGSGRTLTWGMAPAAAPSFKQKQEDYQDQPCQAHPTWAGGLSWHQYAPHCSALPCSQPTAPEPRGGRSWERDQPLQGLSLPPRGPSPRCSCRRAGWTHQSQNLSHSVPSCPHWASP